jgi:hypothetical protein
LIIKYRTGAYKTLVGNEVKREESPRMYPVLHILENIIIEAKCQSKVFRSISDSNDPVGFVVIVLILVPVEYIVVSEAIS